MMFQNRISSLWSGFQVSFMIALLLSLAFCSNLQAYTYNKAGKGDYFIEMLKNDLPMKEVNQPYSIKTVLRNSSHQPWNVQLQYSTIETIRFAHRDENTPPKLFSQTVSVPAGSEKQVELCVIGLPGTLQMHYPVYLNARWKEGDQVQKLQVVLPFESQISLNPNWPTENPSLGQLIENVTELPLNRLNVGTCLHLGSHTTYRGFWTYDKSKVDEHLLPVGWVGSVPESSASIHRSPASRGGRQRQSLHMHPPYRGGTGTVGVEYRFQLPDTEIIELNSFVAIRDNGPSEPSSDGVTFIVGVRPIDSDGVPAAEEILFEKHTDAKDWQPVRVDLSAYSGQEILLRLASDPGPKRNTTCDSCYWGDPVVHAGAQPIFADTQQWEKIQSKRHHECVQAMLSGKSESESTLILPIDEQFRAVVVLGDFGLVDAKIALGRPENFVLYNGIEVAVQNQPIGSWPTGVSMGKLQKVKDALRWSQKITIGDKKATMRYALQTKGPALQLSINCSEPTWITYLRLGPSHEAAHRVYYGHGNCVVKPERFTVDADGHRMSSSHVGMDYPNGISVLVASTVFPVAFTVDTQQKIATPVIRPGTILSLVPGDDGIFQCAKRYREINPKKAAPGVKTKAGRFCFDIWGGTYRQHTELIEHAIQYGLTDSLLIIHNWQRYGYDNRLPDIWPPNSKWGTLKQMRETLEKCEQAGILYGLHDNYIDIYPDAEGYAVDKLSFNADSQPRKAWFNAGIQARSYQFRPDSFMPFLRRNLDLMLPELPQSCYFVDVFSSMPPVDYYDQQGRFHSRTETNEYWGEAFDLIRDKLTQASRDRQNLDSEQKKQFYAPSISEAGHDSLIGRLDGADCQFMFVSNGKAGAFHTHIPCEKVHRVPWYDAVNHTNFSLHGVGYSGRYQAGRSRHLHGILSDDYINAELMTGHALMIDFSDAKRGAVQKYQLLQPTARELSELEIQEVQYVDDHIDRLKIVWSSPDGRRTTTVYSNRGMEPWKIPAPEHELIDPSRFPVQWVLPLYGWVATGSAGVAAVIDNGQEGIVEFSVSNNIFHVNPRQVIPGGRTAIQPGIKAETFKMLDQNRFQCDLLWNCRTTPGKEYSIFVHLVPADWKVPEQGENIVAVYGCDMKIPTTQWDGNVITTLHPATIPSTAKTGVYRLFVGLWDPKTGSRLELDGATQENSRYEVARLNIQRDESGNIRDVKLEESSVPALDPETQLLHSRQIPPKKPLTLGPCTTMGAFTMKKETGRIQITPLPEEPDFELTLKLESGKTVSKILALNAAGEEIRRVPMEQKEDAVTFKTIKGEFRYEMVLGDD